MSATKDSLDLANRDQEEGLLKESDEDAYETYFRWAQQATAPMIEAGVVEYEEQDFDNVLAHHSIYRGTPSVELEKAWRDLWVAPGVAIPEDKLHHLNRTVDLGNGRTLKAIDGGAGGYEATIEVFHQLHCLNTIRQYTWRDWYLNHTHIVPTPEMLKDGITSLSVRTHVDHCIEALRQTLMCHADVTPALVIMEPKGPEHGRTDRNVHQKCRKLEPLLEWSKQHGVGPIDPEID